MTAMILENVPRSLRGELTRWLVEVHPGVFVGRVSAAVRERLWWKVIRGAGVGRCALAYATNSEQGFALRLHAYNDRHLVDFDGLTLVAVQNAEAERKRRFLESRDWSASADESAT